ncbi:MAG TPA: hypothetical protein VMS76_04330 [Planctomycetota bacterium]|nr:hypothetical protein [Planctomycetota bacterium]
MRMVHYFLVAAILFVPALVWTAATGALDAEAHLWAGLFTAVLGIALHTLVILFMIVTGRVLKEAMRTRPLGPVFLEELNQFFAEKRAYPLAGLGAVSIVTAGVLGFAPRGFGIAPAWHVAAGAIALALNLWAVLEEHRALRGNQALLDRTAAELDRLDREQPAGARAEPQGVADGIEPRHLARWGAIIAVSAWLPYLYWGLINWRGDLTRVSLHPWIEISGLGLVLWWLGRRGPR